MKIGVVVNQPTGIKDTVTLAKRVEDLGYHALWLTSGGGGDPIPMLAVLALQTSRVLLGTSIVQTLPRHPVILAQEAHVIAQLAPGRLRLGVGPSHRPLMEAYGLPFDHPLGRLEEYVRILQALFQHGEVKFAGRHYKATATLPSPVDVPVMIGTLRKNAFELAGKVSDGAITWLCPAPFVRNTGVPALHTGATAAGRKAPLMVAHAAVCVSNNADEVRATVRATIGNIRLPYYQQMLVDAGYPEAVNGQWTDKLVDEVILWGDAARVKERLAEMSAAGADEILLKVLQTGGLDSLEPTLKAIAALCAA